MTPFEFRVKAYVEELKTDSVVSYSHITLRRLYGEFGREAVDAELEKYWEAEREARAINERAVVRQFYDEIKESL